MFNDQEPEVRSTNIELSSSTSSKVTLTFQAVLQFLETFLIVLSRMIQNSKSPREVSSQCLNLWYSALKCLKPTSSYPTIILNYRRQAKYCICILLCILHIPSYLHRNTGTQERNDIRSHVYLLQITTHGLVIVIIISCMLRLGKSN